MTLVLGLVLFAGCLIYVVRKLPRSARLFTLFAGLGLPVLMAVPLVFEPDQRVSLAKVKYETSSTCQRCHPEHQESWRKSFHRTMTRPATDESVFGDFDDATVTFFGVTSRFYREGDGFYIDTVDPVWEEQLLARGGDLRSEAEHRRRTFRIDLAIGSHNYQQYAARQPNGLLVRLPLAWDIGEHRWMHMNGAFLEPDNQKFHNHAAPWNLTCALCHNVKARPRMERGQFNMEELATRQFDTVVEEYGIACEACHGPGEKHVAAQTSMARRYYYAATAGGDPTIVNPARLDKERSAEVCGHCHSVRVFHRMMLDDLYHGDGDPYTAGEILEAYVHNMRPDAFRDGLGLTKEFNFWPDGSNKRTSIEYLGMTESACFKKGDLTCLSCHQMHAEDPVDQLAEGMRTSVACTGCHTQYESEAQQTAHSHHKPGSSGNDCYNCHMPNVTWGLRRGMRTHRIGSPTVRGSAEGGIPHACNQCHLDKTLAWTQEHAGRWYNEEASALAADDRDTVQSLVHLLRGDASQRVLSAWSFGWGPARSASRSADSWAPRFLFASLADDYPLVRHAAFRSLRGYPGFADAEFDYLGDPDLRARQIETLRVRLNELPRAMSELSSAAILLPDSGVPDESGMNDLLGRQDRSRVFIDE